MKRCITVLSILLGLAGRCFAAGDAQSVLRRTAEYVRSLGSYGAAFELTSDDYVATGSYSVAGDAYRIILYNAEVYSDGKVRYEVDNLRREITVDAVDTTSRNILDNPTRCFDFVGSDYVSEIASRDGDAVTLHLRSSDPDVEGDIYLTVSETSGRPSMIVYTLYDDRITVRITSLSHTDTPLERFDRSAYRNYEMIDFR